MMSYDPSSLNRNKTLLEAIEEVKKFLIANPCYKIYFANIDYNPNATIYSIDRIDDSTGIAPFDVVFFTNSYYGKIESIGESTFTILEAIEFRGATGPQGPTGATGPQGFSMRVSAQNHNELTKYLASLTEFGISPNIGDVVVFDDGYIGVIQTIDSVNQTYVVSIPDCIDINGAYVVNATINSSNHLIITLSNGTTIDAGVVSGGGGGGETAKYLHVLTGWCKFNVEGSDMDLMINISFYDNVSTPYSTIAAAIQGFINAGYLIDANTQKPLKACSGFIGVYADGGANFILHGICGIDYPGMGILVGGYFPRSTSSGTSYEPTFMQAATQDSSNWFVDSVVGLMG